MNVQILTCRYCGEDIRRNPIPDKPEWGEWEDRETHYSCATGPNRDRPHEPDRSREPPR